MSNKLLKRHYNGHGLYRVIPDPRYLTLLTNGYGTLSADALSGYSGNIAHLTATPNEKYKLQNYDVTGASIEGNDLTFADEDCTAKANFERYIWDLSLQNDGHGSIGASKLTGQSGDTITLSNTPEYGYSLSGYSVTGASINGSILTMNNQNATAKAWFTYDIPSVTIGTRTWSRINIQIDDGGSGIYKFDNVTSGVNWGTQYYYTSGAAVRIANLIPGWRLPTKYDIDLIRTAATSTMSTYAGTNLKTTTGWYKSKNGYDTFGFSGAPVGYMNLNGNVSKVGTRVIYPMLNISELSGFELTVGGTVGFTSLASANGTSAFPLRLVKE